MYWKRKIVFISCIITVLVYYGFNSVVKNGSKQEILSSRFDVTRNRKFLINTTGCQIPNYDPFDPLVKHLYQPIGNLLCSGPVPLVNFNRSHIMLNKQEIEKHFHNINCTFRAILRKGEDKSDDEYGFSEKKQLLTTIKMEDEFIKIECKNTSGSTVYTELLPFIQVKPNVEKKCRNRFKKWVKKTEKFIQERMSVTLIGIDSVSRLNMLRHMPKTYNYLISNMNAIELKGFIKVADNTFVNIVPLLSGLFVEECWNETLDHESMNFLNLIWKNFSRKGFRTFYAEDDPGVATFNYLKSGFGKQPTDYYMRPYTLAVRDSTVQQRNVNCYNNRPETEITLKWLMDFLITFKNKPTFAYLFNTRLTHNDLNYAGYAEEIYYKFFQEYNTENLNQNSVLIVFSDHGIRFGNIRDTYIGKIEERMPFVFLIFPLWFQKKYPKLWHNLQVNQNRLTTFFDLHETLKEILTFTGEEKLGDISNRGISLLSKIPQERTCENAAILPHWCVCHEKILMSITDPIVLKSAEVIINEINKQLLTANNKCANLSIDKIIDARASGLGEKVLRFQESKNDVIDRKVIYGNKASTVWEYLLTISVKPSYGSFEATVKYFESNDTYKLSDVSRINKYGKQSDCINSVHLKKFCFCI